jgi:hypothetical protein
MIFNSNKRKHILINGSPKSGTLYLSRAICNVLQCDSMRISSRGVTESQVDAEAIYSFVKGKSCVAQQHIAPTKYNVDVLQVFKLTKFILILRDPRDVLVSWAHHLLREDIRDNKWHFALTHASGIICEKYYDLSWDEQLDTLIDNGFELFQKWEKGWLDYLQDKRLDIFLLRYEDFAVDNYGTINSIMDHFDVKNTFGKKILPNIEKMNGEIDRSTHFRKGKAGIYAEELSEKQISRLNGKVDRELFNRMNWLI